MYFFFNTDSTGYSNNIYTHLYNILKTVTYLKSNENFILFHWIYLHLKYIVPFSMRIILLFILYNFLFKKFVLIGRQECFSLFLIHSIRHVWFFYPVFSRIFNTLSNVFRRLSRTLLHLFCVRQCSLLFKIYYYLFAGVALQILFSCTLTMKNR